MAQRDLTFGVEFEFVLALQRDWSDDTPGPEAPRQVRFEPEDPDFDDAIHADPSLLDENREDDQYKLATDICAKRHVRLWLARHGFPTIMLEHYENQYEVQGMRLPTMCEVKQDETVSGPDGTEYDWLPIEVTTPALSYDETWPAWIKRLCDVLKAGFVVLTNETCGLHVHVALGTEPLEFITLKYLAAFLWAFEPQINSLHPRDRLDTDWCRTMRMHARYARKYFEKYGRKPEALMGVNRFLRCTTHFELVNQAVCAMEDIKFHACNFYGPLERADGVAKASPTIEFRLHRGTLDEGAVQWIATVLGIVTFLRTSSPVCIAELFKISLRETWEKLRDGRDHEREERLGPILAERDFTIIDLLRYMDLQGPADYYVGKWYIHDLDPPPQFWQFHQRNQVRWAYETRLDPSSAEYREADRRRKIWDDLRTIKKPGTKEWIFDHESLYWGEHYPIVDDWDRDTDASTGGQSAVPSETDNNMVISGRGRQGHHDDGLSPSASLLLEGNFEPISDDRRGRIDDLIRQLNRQRIHDYDDLAEEHLEIRDERDHLAYNPGLLEWFHQVDWPIDDGNFRENIRSVYSNDQAVGVADPFAPEHDNPAAAARRAGVAADVSPKSGARHLEAPPHSADTASEASPVFHECSTGMPPLTEAEIEETVRRFEEQRQKDHGGLTQEEYEQFHLALPDGRIPVYNDEREANMLVDWPMTDAMFRDNIRDVDEDDAATGVPDPFAPVFDTPEAAERRAAIDPVLSPRSTVAGPKGKGKATAGTGDEDELPSFAPLDAPHPGKMKSVSEEGGRPRVGRSRDDEEDVDADTVENERKKAKKSDAGSSGQWPPTHSQF